MVEESHIARVVELVWNATLGLPVGTWDSSIVRPDLSCMTSAYVRISGAWGGTIGIHVPDAIARQAAAIMFNIPLSDVTEADWRDAFGELANQIGGNLKALLPESCFLSLPTVTYGDVFLADLPDTDLLLEFVAESGGLPIVVTMVELLASREDVQSRFHSSAEHA